MDRLITSAALAAQRKSDHLELTNRNQGVAFVKNLPSCSQARTIELQTLVIGPPGLSLRQSPERKNYVPSVTNGDLAEHAGIQEGDRVLSVQIGGDSSTCGHQTHFFKSSVKI